MLQPEIQSCSPPLVKPQLWFLGAHTQGWVGCQGRHGGLQGKLRETQPLGSLSGQLLPQAPSPPPSAAEA